MVITSTALTAMSMQTGFSRAAIPKKGNDLPDFSLAPGRPEGTSPFVLSVVSKEICPGLE